MALYRHQLIQQRQKAVKQTKRLFRRQKLVTKLAFVSFTLFFAGVFLSGSIFNSPNAKADNGSGGLTASNVLGQEDGNGNPDYNQSSQNDGQSSVNNIGYNYDTATALDTTHHRLFVSDDGNSRVLVYDLDNNNNLISNTPTYVIGQPDFTSNDSGISSTTFGGQTYLSLAYDAVNNRLFVTDPANNRVLVFDTSTISDGMAASNVIGQPDFTTNTWDAPDQYSFDEPNGVTFDSTTERLFVADAGDSRIMVFNVDPSYMSQFANGNEQSEPAEAVLGQPDYASDNYGSSQTELSSDLYGAPAIDSTSQRLFVPDAGNNRILVFNVDPSYMSQFANGNEQSEPAEAVLGQPDYTTNQSNTTQNGLNSPEGLDYDSVSQQLFVDDSGNCRILEFDVNSADLSNGENADFLVGQPSYTSNNCDASQDSFSYPDDSNLTYDDSTKNLYVPDPGANRLLVFNFHFQITTTSLDNGIVGTGYSQTINTILGTPSDFSVTSGSLPPGLSINSSSGIISGTPTVSGNYSFSISATDESTGNVATSQDYSVFIDNGPASSYNATDVLGQFDQNGNPTFNQGYINAQGLDTNYTNFGGGGNENGGSGVAIDDQDHLMFVTDCINDRIMVYKLNNNNEIASRTASYVIGQPNFSTNNGGANYQGSSDITGCGLESLPNPTPTAKALSQPTAISYSPSTQQLFVADTGNSRILVYDLSGGVSDDMAASYVIGQPNFSSGEANQGGSVGANTLNDPAGFYYDDSSSTLYVSDSNNSRVLVYDLSGGISDGMSASSVLGQPNLNSASPKGDNLSWFWPYWLYPTYEPVTASTLNGPEGIYYDDSSSTLYVSDSFDNRILVYDLSGGVSDDMAASYVIGQPDFSSQGINQAEDPYQVYYGSAAANTLYDPGYLYYDSANKRLIASDTNNGRVLVYDLSGGVSDDMNATYALGVTGLSVAGQGDCGSVTASTLCAPNGLTYDPSSQQLWVSDSGYNRILDYDLSGGVTTGMSAVDEVGHVDANGQAVFTTGVVDNSLNTDLGGGLSSTYVDPVHHELFVASTCWITVYDLNDSNELVNHTPVNYIGGHGAISDAAYYHCNPTDASHLSPQGVTGDPSRNLLFVSDPNSNRVLVYDLSGGISDNMDATYVIGQPDFTSNSVNQGGSAGPTTLSSPSGGMAYDPTTQMLYVADGGNNRIMVFNTSNLSNDMSATYVIGQSDFDSSSDNSMTDTGFGNLAGLALDSINHRLFVADTNDGVGRIMIFNDQPSYMANYGNGTAEPAENVLGQSGFTNGYPASYNGEANNSYFTPTGLAYNSNDQQLFVDDGSNDRLLLFDLSDGVSNGMAAAAEIGQANFATTSSCSSIVGINQPTQNSLCNPGGVDDYYDTEDNTLYLSDSWNNRVLIFKFAQLESTAPGGVAGSNYSFSSDEYYQGEPTTTLKSGTLPPGLSLNASNGVISGTPECYGNYTFTLKLADDNGSDATFTDTKTYSVGIDGTNTPGDCGQSSAQGGSSGSTTSPKSTTPTSTSGASTTSSTTSSSSPINLNNQSPYNNGSGYSTTSSPGQTYTVTASDGSSHTITVTSISPNGVILTINPGGTVITIKPGQTIDQSVTNSGKPDIAIGLSSISGNKARLTFAKIKLTSSVTPLVSPTKPTTTPTHKHKTLFTNLLYVFPWLLFILIGLISLVLVYRAYYEAKKQKQLNKQLAWETSLSEQKNNFISLSSHYFRTPLTLITNGIELATGQSDDSVKQDFSVLTTKLKASVDELIKTITAPVAMANPPASTVIASSSIATTGVATVTPLSATVSITEPKAISRNIMLSLIASFMAVGVADLILNGTDLYNLEYITFMEQLAALVLITITLLSARRLYLTKKAVNDNTKNLIASQASLDEHRDSLIKQSLLVLDEPIKGLKVNLTKLTQSQGNDKLTAPAMNGITRFESMLSKFTLITLLKSDVSKPLQKEDIDIKATIDTLLPKYEATIKAKQLSIKTELHEPTIYQNKALLTEALDSLISNAIKYSKENEPVTVSTTKHGQTINLTVANKGIALSHEKIDQIFEPFSRAEDVSADFNQEGMGLSLYMDKLIMEYLGGTINLGSEPSKSTTLALLSVPEPA